jgi:LPXTG-site transpeptidase (sortase) family protein
MNFDLHKRLSFAKLSLQKRLSLQKLPRNFVPAVLILVGALLVGYVLSQYGEMYFEQKRMAEQWEQEQQRRAEQTPIEQAHAQKDDGMIRLVIPKIDLTSFVVEGTTHKALLLGPGHLTNTAEPGDSGNSVISGHRDTFFRHIHELEKGDEFFVERGGKRFVYAVTGKKIVEPNDLSVTRPSSESQLTLITCYPTYYIGPAPKRLVVFSKLENQVDSSLAVNDSPQKSVPHIEAVSIGTH